MKKRSDWDLIPFTWRLSFVQLFSLLVFLHGITTAVFLAALIHRSGFGVMIGALKLCLRVNRDFLLHGDYSSMIINWRHFKAVMYGGGCTSGPKTDIGYQALDWICLGGFMKGAGLACVGSQFVLFAVGFTWPMRYVVHAVQMARKRRSNSETQPLSADAIYFLVLGEKGAAEVMDTAIDLFEREAMFNPTRARLNYVWDAIRSGPDLLVLRAQMKMRELWYELAGSGYVGD